MIFKKNTNEHVPELKRFIRKLSVFSCLVVVVCILLLLIPADKKYNFSYTHDNCLGQGTWMYKRIYEDSLPIDIAFIGSSHTICAVNDSLLEMSMIQKRRVNIANMGYCRLGRNLHHSFASRLCAVKQPGYIILEVSERENRMGHPEFGYFAEGKELLLPVLVYNPDLFKDMYYALSARMSGYKQVLLSTNNQPAVPARRYGYMNSSQVADPGQLIAAKVKNKAWVKAKGFSRWFNNRYPLSYIERIHRLTQEHNCALLFLYLPAYGAMAEPEEAEFYRLKGELLIPPDSIYGNPAYWKDTDHMNEAGATSLTLWLASALQKV